MIPVKGRCSSTVVIGNSLFCMFLLALTLILRFVFCCLTVSKYGAQGVYTEIDMPPVTPVLKKSTVTNGWTLICLVRYLCLHIKVHVWAPSFSVAPFPLDS